MKFVSLDINFTSIALDWALLTALLATCELLPFIVSLIHALSLLSILLVLFLWLLIVLVNLFFLLFVLLVMNSFLFIVILLRLDQLLLLVNVILAGSL